MPSKFGNEFQINTYTNNSQAGPEIASLDNGYFIVVWQSFEQDDDHWGTYGQILNVNGNKIGNEFQVNNYTISEQSEGSVSALLKGDFVVVWQSLQGSTFDIYGQLFNATGDRIGDEFQVNNYTNYNQLYPKATTLVNENFVVVWESDLQDESGIGTYGQVFNVTGGKMGSEFQVNKYTLSDQRALSSIALSNGNFLVVWCSYGQDGSGYGVYGQVFNAMAGKVGNEFQVNTHTANNQYYPSIATLNSGNFVVTWMDDSGLDGWDDGSGLGQGIFGQIFIANGAKVNTQFQVNMRTYDHQTDSSVIGLRNGNFVVAWRSLGQDQDASPGVYGQVFNANGTKIGNEFQINTYISGDQSAPRVALLTNGNFVVTWHSDGQDGSSYGIYGQIFYGQLVAANYGNRTFDYSASMPAKITHLSILGALNDEAISATLTLSDPTAGNLTTGASGNVTANYNSTNGVWQAFGPLADINQLLSNITFLPAPTYHKPLTLAVNITDSVSPLAIGSFGLAPLFSGKPTKLGGEFQINNNTINDQSYPSVAALDNGNFVAVWMSDGQDGSGYGLYGQMFIAGGSKVGNEFLVNNYTTSDQLYPSVAALNNGNFVVIWDSFGQDGSDDGVYGQVFTAGGSKVGNEFLVNAYTTDDQIYPSVAALNNGNFVVVWQSFGQDGSDYGVYGQVFTGSGSKVGNEFLVNTYTAIGQIYPSVAVLNNGNFVVVWMSDGQDGSYWGVYGQMLTAGGNKMGNEFLVTTYTTASQMYSNVAALNNGNFVVVWHSFGHASVSNVYGQVFNADGNKIGNEFPVNTYMPLEQYVPVVVGLGDSNFIVAWESYGQDSDNWGLYGQVFNASGNKIGNEFPINTYIMNGQLEPSLTVLTNRNFVAIWHSYAQDGSSYGIYGQLFYGQLIAANYANRTLPYIEETPSSISHLSILGALNDETVSTTLTLSDPKAGSLKTATSGNVTSIYNATTGRWQALGYLNDINQLLSTLIFLPAPDYKQNVTLAVNMTDGFSAPVLGSLTLTPIPIGQPTRLGNEFQINSITVGSQNNPSIAALTNGNFVVAWDSADQDSLGIYAQIFNPNGIKIGNEFQINNYTTDNQNGPSVASFPNGNFVVGWNSGEQDGSLWGIYAQIWNTTGFRIGNEFQVNTITLDQQFIPTVIALLNTDFAVVWASWGPDGSGWGINGQLFNMVGSKKGNEFQINTNTFDHQYNPHACALTNGNFVVAWHSHYQENPGSPDAGIYAQIFAANGTKLGSELHINTYTANDQGGTAIAALNGSFVVAWGSYLQDGSEAGVYGQIFNSNGTRIGNEFQINTYTVGNQFGPSITELPSDHFIVTWNSNNQDNSGYGRYGQVFNSIGEKVGSEFQINTYTVNNQLGFGVAMLSNGNFVVTWASDGQDGSSLGVYGQLFYGQLVAVNYTNRTLTYTEDAPLLIPNISILGALNEYAINTTLTVIPANAGFLTVSTFGKVTATYLPATGLWQAFGHRIDMNQVLSQLAFTPVKDTNQNVTIFVEFNDGASAPVKGKIDLTAIPINDPPVIMNNQLTVTKGQAVILTPADLSAQDVDTPDSSLTFTVNNIAGGRFEFISDPDVTITSFTQQQINDGQVRFVADGSEVKPAYKVTVSDGALSSATSAATVNFILPNKPPIVLNPLPNEEVTVGESFSFTIPDTTFSDPEGYPLTYSAQRKDGNALPSWLQFNTVNRFFSGTPVQAGVNTLSVLATDAGNLTTQADFNLTAENPSVSTGAVVGGVVGGLAVIAAVGGAAYAFWKKGFCQRKADDNNIPLPDRRTGGGQAVDVALK